VLVTIFKPTPGGRPYPARVFAAYDEKAARGRTDEVEVCLSVEQAEELADWLNAQCFGVRLRLVPAAGGEG
jgi:hypothetical protein